MPCDLPAAEHRKPPSGGHHTDPYLAAAALGFKDHRHACTELLNSDPASIHRASDLSSRVAQWSPDAAGVAGAIAALAASGIGRPFTQPIAPMTVHSIRLRQDLWY